MLFTKPFNTGCLVPKHIYHGAKLQAFYSINYNHTNSKKSFLRFFLNKISKTIDIFHFI
jgi:hypothetical protein